MRFVRAASARSWATRTRPPAFSQCLRGKSSPQRCVAVGARAAAGPAALPRALSPPRPLVTHSAPPRHRRWPLLLAQFRGLDNLFCQYRFVHGPDWRVMQGIDSGFSQVAQKGSSGDASVVWNFPIDVTFKSTNPFGWPRLVLSIYSQVRAAVAGAVARARDTGNFTLTHARTRTKTHAHVHLPQTAQDFLGRFVIRGYGSALLPTMPGSSVRLVRAFAPASSSLLQAGIAWLTGNLPECVAQSRARAPLACILLPTPAHQSAHNGVLPPSSDFTTRASPRRGKAARSFARRARASCASR